MLKKCILALFCLLLAGQSQAQVDPDTILGAWLLDEGQGTTTKDASGNGNNGTLVGAPAWVAGPFGSALQFNGSSTYVNCGNAAALNVKLFSVSFWCNVTAIQGWNHIISRGSHVASGTPGSVNWGVMMYDAQASILFETYNNTGWTGITTNTTVGEWHHLVATYDGDRMQLHYDGTVAATSGTGTGILLDPSRRFLIGVRSDAGGQGGYFNGRVDEVGFFNAVLSPAHITTIMKQGLVAVLGGMAEAADPTPAPGATDVPRDSALGWTAGMFAATHDIYLGTSPTDVSSAGRNNPQGVLVSQGQTDTRHSPQGPLEYGRTYYWRVDEVNAAPDATVFKGDVWSFTVEPYAYPVRPTKATASSAQANMGPEKTIDNSGMTGDVHDTEPTTMWLSSTGAPNWIQYEFDKVYKLNDLQVWNSNQLVEGFLGFGAKKVTVETSVDGTTWTPVASVPEFSRASGLAGYAANTTVSLGVEAKFVKLTISSNWGGVAPQMGLSEVRFSYLPVQARAPQPAASGTGVSVDASLDWRPGRGATSHQVFFGTDQAAVDAGTAPAQTVTAHGFDPGALNFGTTYYWKVDEVGAATYPGSVWSFTTQEFAAVDDFESYTDKAGAEIFTIWVDGFADNYKSSGSTVGKDTAANGTFGETTIIHGGKQSMPMVYDNTKAPFFSEAERAFSPAEDWTGNGAQELVVYFRGSAPGFAETASGSIVMNAIGTDIWNNSDQFRFAYKSLSGDGTMVARVDAIANSNVWAKGGVMIRQNIQGGSVHAFMPITPGGAGAGNGASFQHRLTANGTSTNNDNTGAVVAAPYWVKIERKGNAFTGSISPDGKTWAQLGTPQTITMTNPVLIGLALCSHDAAIATGATFSNVSTTGNVTGVWQVAEIGAAQPTGNSLEGLYVTVKDSSGKTKTVQHPDAAATAMMTWQSWTIPLSEFTAAGVKMTAVKSLTVGVGSKAAPKAGGTGTVYIDDIGYGRAAR